MCFASCSESDLIHEEKLWSRKIPFLFRRRISCNSQMKCRNRARRRWWKREWEAGKSGKNCHLIRRSNSLVLGFNITYDSTQQRCHFLVVVVAIELCLPTTGQMQTQNENECVKWWKSSEHKCKSKRSKFQEEEEEMNTSHPPTIRFLADVEHRTHTGAQRHRHTIASIRCVGIVCVGAFWLVHCLDHLLSTAIRSCRLQVTQFMCRCRCALFESLSMPHVKLLCHFNKFKHFDRRNATMWTHSNTTYTHTEHRTKMSSSSKLSRRCRYGHSRHRCRRHHHLHHHHRRCRCRRAIRTEQEL